MSVVAPRLFRPERIDWTEALSGLLSDAAVRTPVTRSGSLQSAVARLQGSSAGLLCENLSWKPAYQPYQTVHDFGGRPLIQYGPVCNAELHIASVTGPKAVIESLLGPRGARTSYWSGANIEFTVNEGTCLIAENVIFSSYACSGDSGGAETVMSLAASVGNLYLLQ